MSTNNLNTIQNKIVNQTKGPVLVLAGAGSGKTTTITARSVNLIQKHKVSPYNILSLTFTNKAAQEMKERLINALDQNISKNSLWVSTFHGFGAKILRYESENIHLVNLKKGFTIIDGKDSKKIIKNLLIDNSLDEKELDYFITEISRIKHKNVSMEEYGLSKEYDVDVEMIYNKYEETLIKNNVVDFANLLNKTVELLEKSPEILKKYRDKFLYITVDEYQDTNNVQFNLVKLLASPRNNICVVGDDDQSIYSWRNANIENILNFEKLFKNTKVFKLEQNYRSNQNILEVANSIIHNNIKRKDKKLWSDKKSSELIDFTTYDTGRLESEKIIDTIHDLITYKKIDPNEIAILYRNNFISRNFEDKLVKKNIPYKIYGGTKFYERKEIKDMFGYLQLIANQTNEIALERVINMPSRGLGAKTLEKIQEIEGSSTWDKLIKIKENNKIIKLGKKALNGVLEFLECIEDTKKISEYSDLSFIYSNLLDKSGYKQMLQSKADQTSESKLDNLIELGTSIKESESKFKVDFGSEITLQEYLESISLDPGNDKEEHEKVNLMTLHSAKGLEFEHVFVVGLEQQIIPGKNESNIEEERRLIYVGVTRAKNKLYLSYAKFRNFFKEKRYGTETQFVSEIPTHLLKKRMFKEPVNNAWGHKKNYNSFTNSYGDDDW